MNCPHCGQGKYHADWCPLAQDGAEDTKGERREAEAQARGDHPVHGRSLESVMNSIRKRAAALDSGAGGPA